MKKRIAVLMITTIFALTGAGCSQDNSSGQATDSSNAQEEAADSSNAQEEAADSSNTQGEEADSGNAQEAREGLSESSNVLVAYFSVPEDVDTEGIDANAGASVVVRDGQVMGNLEYMADVIQQTIGGDLFRIETVEEYPLDHDPLVDQAAQEQDEEARPELSTQTGDLAAEILKDQGITSALLDIGGNIQAIGSRPDGSDWRLGIRDSFTLNDSFANMEIHVITFS